MTDKLKNIIKEELLKLPKENQEAINSLDWGNIVEEIGKKYLLNESEVNDLQAETLTVLLGLTDWDLYIVDIENDIGTTKDDANKIAQEVNEKVFTPINEIFVENIKKSGKHQNANAEQNLDFVLSGGDYSAFVEKRGAILPPLTGEDRGGVFNTPHPSPLLKGEGNNAPKKMTDIRSKFTI